MWCDVSIYVCFSVIVVEMGYWARVCMVALVLLLMAGAIAVYDIVLPAAQIGFVDTCCVPPSLDLGYSRIEEVFGRVISAKFERVGGLGWSYMRPGDVVRVMVDKVPGTGSEDVAGLSFAVEVYVGDCVERPLRILRRSYNDVPFIFAWSITRVGEYYLTGNTFYWVVVLALRGGRVVDWKSVTISTPRPRPGLTMDRAVYRVGETATLSMANLGCIEICTDGILTIYYLDGENWIVARWVKVEPQVEGFCLKPGAMHTWWISLENAKPGVYRVVKTVTTPLGEAAVSEVSFEVIAG